MARKKELQFTPDLSFTCEQCGLCCNRGWVIGLSGKDRDRLLKVDCKEKYPELNSKHLTVPYSSSYRFCVNDKGECDFLDNQNLCYIHRELGHDAKVTACKVYPYIMVKTKGGIRVGAHFSCPAVVGNSGSPLASNRKMLESLYEELEELRGDREDEAVTPPLWSLEKEITWAKLEILEDTLLEIFSGKNCDILHRVVHASKLLDSIDEHYFSAMNDEEFSELVDNLNSKASDYSVNLGLKKTDLSVMERLLLRLLGGISSEMCFPGLLSQNFFVRQMARYRRLRVCASFFYGKNYVTAGDFGSFEYIEKIKAYPLDDESGDIIRRYLYMKFYCRAYYGFEGLGLGVLHGARLLLSVYSVTVLLAKMFASSRNDGDKTVNKEDVERAIMHVDNTFGHLSNIRYRIITKLLTYLNREKWPERSAMFVSFADRKK